MDILKHYVNSYGKRNQMKIFKQVKIDKYKSVLEKE